MLLGNWCNYNFLDLDVLELSQMNLCPLGYVLLLLTVILSEPQEMHRNKNGAAEMGKETLWVSDIPFLLRSLSPGSLCFTSFVSFFLPMLIDVPFECPHTRNITHLLTMFCNTCYSSTEIFKYYELHKKRLVRIFIFSMPTYSIE